MPLFQALPWFFFLLHKVAEHKYALFACLPPLSQWGSYGCFSKRLQRAHKHIVRTRWLSTRVLSTGVPRMADHANERSGPSTSISLSNSGDTSLIQLYEQTTKTRKSENSSRCINRKAPEKVKPFCWLSKSWRAALHCRIKCMQMNKGKYWKSFRLHSASFRGLHWLEDSSYSCCCCGHLMGEHTDLLSHQKRRADLTKPVTLTKSQVWALDQAYGPRRHQLDGHSCSFLLTRYEVFTNLWSHNEVITTIKNGE